VVVRLGWVAAVVLVGCLGLGATYPLVRDDDAEFGCADVGITTDRSGNDPEEALGEYLAETGGDLDDWVRIDRDADSATFEPQDASASHRFKSISVAQRPAGVWTVAGGCV